MSRVNTAACKPSGSLRSEEHTSELQSQFHIVCRLLLEKKKQRDVVARAIRRRIIERSLEHLCLDGAASVPGFWACGEAACSGVHGANRLSFFLNDTATTEIYTLSLHDVLPI